MTYRPTKEEIEKEEHLGRIQDFARQLETLIEDYEDLNLTEDEIAAILISYTP